MKFGKIIALGTILAACAPAALADRLYGELTGSGRGTIGSTSLTFSNATNDTGVTGAGNKRPLGNIISGSGGLSDFSTAQSLFYHFTTPYTFTYSSATNAAAVELFQVTEDGETLKFYLTSVDPTSVVVGTNDVGGRHPVQGKTGTFTGEGYITLSNDFVSGSTTELDPTFVDFQLTNTGRGAGLKSFSFDLVAPTPEPSSLLLLGTGMIGTAGMAFRRLRATKSL